MTDEEKVKAKYPNVKIFEGGDGCHIEIPGVPHPHFYGNLPCNAWKKVAAWTDSARIEASHE